MLKVRLFLPYVSDQWHSIERFSDLLCQKNSLFSDTADISPFRPPSYWNSFGEVFGRRFLYTLNCCLQKFDIYHIVDPSYSHLLQFLPRNKTVITCHDLEFWYRRNFWNSPIRLWILNHLFSTGCIVTPSLTVKNELLSLARERKISPPPIEVIANAPGKEFQPSREKDHLKKEWTFNQRPLLLNIANTRWPRKNFSFLLEVLENLKQRIPDVHLIQVGPSWTSEHQFLIDSKNLSHSISHFTNLDSAKIIELYQMADLYVQPSTYEGFGYPLLEALSCDLPILVSDIPVFQEILNGKSGPVPLESHLWVSRIEHLLQNPPRRMELLQEQKGTLTFYSPERQQEAYRRIYEQLAKN